MCGECGTAGVEGGVGKLITRGFAVSESLSNNGTWYRYCERKNVFEQLMEARKYNSLGQISHALYDVGGEYRRNM